jgi:hypothetical protein
MLAVFRLDALSVGARIGVVIDFAVMCPVFV